MGINIYPWYVEQVVLERDAIKVGLLGYVLHVDHVQELECMDGWVAKVFD